MADDDAPIPGWYDDPQDPSGLRWWDGSDWTDQTRLRAPAAGTPSPAPGPAHPVHPHSYPGMGHAAPHLHPGAMPMLRPDAPNATTAMVLGIVGLVGMVCCCSITAPIALFLGKGAMNAVDRSGGALGGREQAKAGYVMGIIGTVLLVLQLLYILAAFVFGMLDEMGQI